MGWQCRKDLSFISLLASETSCLVSSRNTIETKRNDVRSYLLHVPLVLRSLSELPSEVYCSHWKKVRCLHPSLLIRSHERNADEDCSRVRTVSYFFPPRTMLRSFWCAAIAAATLKLLDPFKSGKIVLFAVSYDKVSILPHLSLSRSPPSPPLSPPLPHLELM